MNDQQTELSQSARWSKNTEDLPLVIGLDLGGTQIRTAVLRGEKLLSRVGLLTGESPSPDRLIPRMYDSIHQALREANVTLDEIAGIGIGAPGPLNSRTGVIFSPPNLPGWRDVPLRSIFFEKFNIPIYVENDANAAALGEFMFGAGRGSNEVVYITISTGIGGGVIADGHIIEGISGTAAELGHMTIDWRGPRCNCGNIGCWESISSGTAIARRAHELIALGRGEKLFNFALAHQEPVTDADTPADVKRAQKNALHINARMVSLAAQAGIPEAREIIAGAAEGIGVGLINVVHIFNPELIVLGGGVVQMGDALLEPARRILKERAMKVPAKSAKIVLAKLGSDVGLVGAGALSYYNH
ncbi:ROK family protein [Dictyobacter formicarum]|uniref:N-acylmannosamine kinase n=1 Tax=Dictyobacter formicarum TaxID=2778368 RepID=A0ABQ3VKV6_9CHLR|nr:ROK family protein [Dictyobacter formicarum]GHO86542.1 N-acylmannosamine kinase [Dictyobacter formicarum]